MSNLLAILTQGCKRRLVSLTCVKKLETPRHNNKEKGELSERRSTCISQLILAFILVFFLNSVIESWTWFTLDGSKYLLGLRENTTVALPQLTQINFRFAAKDFKYNYKNRYYIMPLCQLDTLYWRTNHWFEYRSNKNIQLTRRKS